MTRILRIRHIALAALVAFTLPVTGCFDEEALNEYPDTVGFDSYDQLGRSVNMSESAGLIDIPVMLIGPHRSSSISVEVAIAEVNPIVGTYQAGGAYESPLVNGQHFTVSALNLTIPANASYAYIESLEGLCFPVDAPYGAQASVVLEIVGASDVEVGENFKFFTTTLLRASGNNAAVTTQNAGCESNNPPHFTSEAVTAAEEGSEYSYRVAVRDPEQVLPDYDFDGTVSLSAVELPSWLTFTDAGVTTGAANNRRRVADLEGTPSAADVGMHTVVIAATDELFTTEHTFTIEVTAAD